MSARDAVGTASLDFGRGRLTIIVGRPPSEIKFEDASQGSTGFSARFRARSIHGQILLINAAGDDEYPR